MVIKLLNKSRAAARLISSFYALSFLFAASPAQAVATCVALSPGTTTYNPPASLVYATNNCGYCAIPTIRFIDGFLSPANPARFFYPRINVGARVPVTAPHNPAEVAQWTTLAVRHC